MQSALFCEKLCPFLSDGRFLLLPVNQTLDVISASLFNGIPAVFQSHSPHNRRQFINRKAKCMTNCVNRSTRLTDCMAQRDIFRRRQFLCHAVTPENFFFGNRHFHFTGSPQPGNIECIFRPEIIGIFFFQTDDSIFRKFQRPQDDSTVVLLLKQKVQLVK